MSMKFDSVIITIFGFKPDHAYRLTKALATPYLDRAFPESWKTITVPGSVIQGCLGNGTMHIISVSLFKKNAFGRNVEFSELIDAIKKECKGWLVPAIEEPILIVAPQFYFWEEIPLRRPEKTQS